MERYKRRELKEALYLTKLFNFPEWDSFKSATVAKLSSLFEERDSLIEDVVEGSAAVSQWMNSMSVNSFEGLIESEKLLISLLSKKKALTKKEKKILDLAKQILGFLKKG